jgi:superfamily I DNA/RNA helicase
LQIQIALELISQQTQAITFVKDGTQRIYKANYIWDDINLTFGPGTQLELLRNYRNTREIAQVAASFMRAETDNDVNILDPSMTIRSGPKPIWVQGKYTIQKEYLKKQLRTLAINQESVAILHIQSRTVNELSQELINLGYICTILKQDDSRGYVPYGIYLSTLNSAKGLEFDHIFIIGYDDFFAPGPSRLSHRETSAHLSTHRKLLYTAISRARMTLTITSSINQYSRFLNDIDQQLISLIRL